MASVAAFVLPANLVDSVRTDPAPGRHEWLRVLPDIVVDLAERWSLRLGQPYQPAGDAPGSRRCGTSPGVTSYSRSPGGTTRPPTKPMASGPGPATARCACTTATRSTRPARCCWNAATPGPPSRRPARTRAGRGRRRPPAAVVDRAHRRLPVPAAAGDVRRLGRRVRREAHRVGRALDPGLARAGIELFRGLPATAERQVLLCTDLHAGNVLAAQREPWLVIDPKPYVGDPTYDALQHLLNCEERLVADPVGLAARLADLLGLRPRPAFTWLFARCVRNRSTNRSSPRSLPV